eukprot:3531780-Prymnesium_polylepis.1
MADGRKRPRETVSAPLWRPGRKRPLDSGLMPRGRARRSRFGPGVSVCRRATVARAAMRGGPEARHGLDSRGRVDAQTSDSRR